MTFRPPNIPAGFGTKDTTTQEDLRRLRDVLRNLSSQMSDLQAQIDEPGIADRIKTSGTPVSIGSTPPSSGQTLVASSATSASWQTPSSVAGDNPYLSVPGSPDAFDDEFNSGSPDLATRGWTVIDAIAAAAVTRSGDIDPWNTSGPVGNTYWSTIIGSRIFIQGRPGQAIFFYKSITLAAGDTFFVRVGGSFNLSSGATDRQLETGVCGASGINIDGNNRVITYTTGQPGSAGANWQLMNLRRITGGGFSGPFNQLTIGGEHDIRGVHFRSGTDWDAFMVCSGSGQVISTPLSGAPAAASLVRYYVGNQFTTNGGNNPQIMTVDFVRRKTGNAWIIP